jgi:hypothetical protein
MMNEAALSKGVKSKICHLRSQKKKKNVNGWTSNLHKDHNISQAVPLLSVTG